MSASFGTIPPFTELAGTACTAHPARAAVALCRSCLTPRCGECVVKIDGVNHCAACLRALFPATPPPRPPAAASTALRAVARGAAAIVLYGAVALAAAAAGVALPFFSNERQLAANRARITDVHLALSAYFADVGRYPEPERGLGALLAAGAPDRADWRGPYVTARAAGGRPARDPADEGKVLDVFGRPVVYFASPMGPEDEDGVPEKIYLASPGANGAFETPGVREGRAPRDEAGDDVVQWVRWP